MAVLQMNSKFVLLAIGGFSYAGLLLCLTRQFPFNFLSGFLSIFLCFTVTSQVAVNNTLGSKYSSSDLIALLIIMFFVCFWSLMQGNSPQLIVRFAAIIFFINIVLLFQKGNAYFISIFKFAYFLQSLVVICLGVSFLLFFDPITFSPIRSLFRDSGWGDVYSYDDVFYRVQLLGNALIPVFFFLNYVWAREGRYVSRWLLVCSFLAVVFAGNLAFYLAIFIFVLIFELKALGPYGRKINKYKFFFVVIFVMFLPFFLTYVFSLLVMKSSGSGSSIGTRFDQIQILLDSLGNTVITTAFGNGIGYTLNVVSNVRDYSGNVYYELQSLYFLNQLGVVPFFIIFSFHIYLFLKRISDFNLRLVYFIYLFYASINPYFLDTSHVAVLLLLISLDTPEDAEKNSLYSYRNSQPKALK